MGKGKGRGEAAKSWPREERSRRVGWTEGPAIVLGDGRAWHLPKLDAGLIPHLRSLGHMATQIADYEEMMESWTGCFLHNLLKIQYRNRYGTLVGLTKRADKAVAGPVLWSYFDEFRRFAGRIPLGDEGGVLPPGLN